MSSIFGDDPVRDSVRRLLDRLEAGQPVDETHERQCVDLKEEDGRRDRTGAVGPSIPHNETAAKQLAKDAACMANTPGGGALIVGVSDAGELIGTDLDDEWLRHRMYELSGKRLTTDVSVRPVREHRLLVIVAPQAIEPISVAGRTTWRVGTNCVDVDPTAWHTGRLVRMDFDWSAQESTVPVAEARAGAVEQARTFLSESGESHAEELAKENDGNLLRRLNVVTGSGLLTNTGVLAFTGRRSHPCLDYIRRNQTAGDSVARVRRTGRSLLEELAEVFQTFAAHNPVEHVQHALSIGQFPALPPRAAREAIVNGVAHREWGIVEPTTVEHIGRTLRVTSPGGFVGGVTAHNIITHPSRSRNRSLTELLATLRIAEREGIGVDRMMHDMIRLGHRTPNIQEIAGPAVRTALIGDDIDTSWMSWLRFITPSNERGDLNSLLILRHLVETGWADVQSITEIIQLDADETRGALAKLANARHGDANLIVAVDGVPADSDNVWRLSGAAATSLRELDRNAGKRRPWPSREQLATTYVTARGRISSTELGSLAGASPTNIQGVLRSLEHQGVVEPSRQNRRGMGFFYRRASR